VKRTPIEEPFGPIYDRIEAAGVYYHMQLPPLLRATVEPEARLFAVEDERGVVVEVEVPGAVRLQRPLGPGGLLLLRDVYRERIRAAGCLVCGLRPAEWEDFTRWLGRSLTRSEDTLETADISAYDPLLRGGPYHDLRHSVNHFAQRGGEIQPYDPGEHRAAAILLLEDWMARRGAPAAAFIRGLLERPPRDPRFITLVGVRDGALRAVGAAMQAGPHGYMVYLISAADAKYAGTVVDHRLISALHDRGVKRLDWGVSPRKSLTAYKEQFRPIERTTLFTSWCPQGALPLTSGPSTSSGPAPAPAAA
jgi:hypothetical protein